MDSKLNVIATHICSSTEDLYLLVDFLNRNLKEKDVLFGLSKSHHEPGKMVITLYRSTEQ